MSDNAEKHLSQVPALRRLLCQHSLFEYCKEVMPNFQFPPHILYLIKFWEAIESGRIRRGMIALPPRHGKTQLWMLVVAWLLGRHPDWQIAVASYGAELTESWGRKVRAIIAGDAHQRIFPGCQLSPESAAAHRLELTRGGGARFVGRGGTLLGTGAHVLIADDLYENGEEARSEKVKRSTWEWFNETFLTRLEPGGRVVVIGSRWSEDDVIGRLICEHANEGWELVHFPAIAEANDPLGRAEGSALWPERYDREDLENIRRQIGSAAFVNIFQGRPTAAEGVIFQRQWFRSYSGPLPSFQRTVQSWDTAFGKNNNSGDYSVCTTWGLNNNGYYLLALWRGRVEFPKLKWQVGQQAQQWKPHAIYIEDSASGQSLVQELLRATSFPVIPVKIDRDKQARAEAVTPLFEAGRVFFPAEVPWRRDLEDELASFPVATHDDQVDSVTMALNCLRESTYASEPPPFLTSESQFTIAGLRRYLSSEQQWPFGWRDWRW
jgi:predicted phage terminase large subunit-like protein